MNLNELARTISKMEGGKKEVNIAQIKEIVSRLGCILADMKTEDSIKLVERMMKSGKR